MNRYRIRNLKTGQEFEATGEAFPPRHPFWGAPAGTKLKSLCDAWELANGAPAGLDPQGMELWAFQDSMQVVSTTNIDAEIAAEAVKAAQFEARLVKLASLTKADLKTAGNFDLDKVADALLDVAKAVRRMAKGD